MEQHKIGTRICTVASLPRVLLSDNLDRALTYCTLCQHFFIHAPVLHCLCRLCHPSFTHRPMLLFCTACADCVVLFSPTSFCTACADCVILFLFTSP